MPQGLVDRRSPRQSPKLLLQTLLQQLGDRINFTYFLSDESIAAQTNCRKGTRQST